MTRLAWPIRTICPAILLLGMSCGGKTHIVGSVADGSAGGEKGGLGGTASAGGAVGSGGLPGQDGPLNLGGTTGIGGSASLRDAAVATGGASAGGGATGAGGTGGAIGRGGSGGTPDGGGGRASGGSVGTGGVVGGGGGGGSGGVPVDAGRLCPPPGGNCCFLDEDCQAGYECAGATCTAERQSPGICEYVAALGPGQCWRDSDCPAESDGCRGQSICPCGALCVSPDRPGTCAMPDGTGGAIGTGGAGGGGGTGGGGGSGGSAGSSGDGGLDGGVTECEQRGGQCQSVPLTADPYAWCVSLSGNCLLPASAYEGALGCAAGADGVIPICCLPRWEQPSGQCAAGGTMACYPQIAGLPNDRYAEMCPLGWSISNATCEQAGTDCCGPPIYPEPICEPWP
ncbi:MAG: hypothetical protein JXP73_13385 [Deltaproteobacteria bacterium]|nr:hypothetical protein [Deltaproteobacteria bacterium]